MSSYTFCLIFAKLDTFVHFVVNSNLEKIWVDSDIIARVMTSSIKCGSRPPHKPSPLLNLPVIFSKFRKAKKYSFCRLICMKIGTHSLNDVQNTM